MEIETVKIVIPFHRDDNTTLFVNGEEIASANYQEHGSGGIEVLELVAARLAELANLELDEVDEEDDEDDSETEDE